ncbi:MBL fold metallo-hydrolase [Aestuariivirga litoralis]|uniref:MBL fold metallo-hydrolase n=1 Tax=Aestuariivirga litoralis TaxID=2650924 RepID=UPI0018C4C4F1|nr:MBL fold metallo-hydrolase [Aestuariivirga litoralis]MBG1233305.1 MBL fold metallo-hydrolase [Aestuariivirga litoralis]
MTVPLIHAFFDEPSKTVTYLVIDPETRDAAVVDPVFDYDHASGKASVKSADAVLAKAEAENCKIRYVLETHVHADHLSGAPYIKLKTGAAVVIGERIKEVQAIFRPVFNAVDVSGSGAEFDLLVKDGEKLLLGALEIEVISTPGHTPACVSYKIADAVFVGDTLFMPDYGTARADFPGGNAADLYHSIKRLLAMPAETRLFMCHDYLPKGGRTEYTWETTVSDQRLDNIHVHDGVSAADFVSMREARDKTLSAPTFLMPSIQVNMRAGKLPPADANGVHYIKVPITL